MSKSRDQRIADETLQYDEKLMCKAKGCPHRWSVNAGSGKLCSAHAWSDPQDWPRITREQSDAETDRAMYGSPARHKPPAAPLTLEQKRAIGAKLRQAMRNPGGRDWAYRLRDREARGEKLNQAQRTMWREALGIRGDVLDPELEAA